MAAAAPPSPLLPKEEEEEEEDEEEYIDMDVSSSTFLYYTFTTAPPLSDDFEFHLSSRDAAANVSPADELFYKGKLLPLHLPPRLQMLERLLRSNPDAAHELPPVSPLDKCYAGIELPPREPVKPVVRQRWPGRLGFIRRCSSGLKVIISRSFTIKSSFFRPPRPHGRDSEEEENCERRSVSGAIHRYLPVTKQSRCSSSCSSSSCSPPSSSASSGSSNGTYVSPVMRRSSSMDSEEGSSIQRAIAYCKSTSQQRQKQQEIGSM